MRTIILPGLYLRNRRELILGRDISWGVGVQNDSVTLI